MKFKISVLLMVIILGVVSCKSSQKAADDFDISYLEGYFTKNTVEYEKEVIFMVATHNEAFSSYFGMAKLMNNTISNVDFGVHNVAALITKPSAERAVIRIVKTEMVKNELIVHFQTTKNKKASYHSNDTKIFAIPKDIKKVTFISAQGTAVVEVH